MGRVFCKLPLELDTDSMRDPPLDSLEDALSEENVEEEMNHTSASNEQAKPKSSQTKKKGTKSSNKTAKAVKAVAEPSKKRGSRKKLDNKVRRPYKSFDDARLAKKYSELSARLDVANKRQSVLQLKYDRYKFEIDFRKSKQN